MFLAEYPVMTLQKGGTNAKKITGDHSLVFQGEAISKKCLYGSHFLVYQTKVISKKSYLF